MFPQIIHDLETCKLLKSENEAALFGIIINLLLRTRLYRQSLDLILNDERRRNFLLDEIFGYLSNSELLIKGLNALPKESELNYISILLYERIMIEFAEFYYSILETDSNRGWFTSDNPVMIGKTGQTDHPKPEKSDQPFRSKMTTLAGLN